jgi:hypothetical protein
MKNIRTILITSLLTFSLSASALDISVESGSAIENMGRQTRRISSDSETAIAQLTYQDLWRAPRTLVTQGRVRIDMQGTTGEGHRNIQIQINGLKGHSTISTALVSPELSTTNHEAEQRYIIRKVRHALNESLKSGNVYKVS